MAATVAERHVDVVGRGDRRGSLEPIAQSALWPDPARHATYQELIEVYAACEAHALGKGPDPSPQLADFAAAQDQG